MVYKGALEVQLATCTPHQSSLDRKSSEHFDLPTLWEYGISAERVLFVLNGKMRSVLVTAHFVRFSCNVSLRTISLLVSSMRTMTKHSLLIATAIDETARYDLMLARERSSPNSLLGSRLLGIPTQARPSLFIYSKDPNN